MRMLERIDAEVRYWWGKLTGRNIHIATRDGVCNGCGRLRRVGVFQFGLYCAECIEETTGQPPREAF